jgi:hypothetical protein
LFFVFSTFLLPVTLNAFFTRLRMVVGCGHSMNIQVLKNH